MYLDSITDRQFLDLGQDRQIEILSEHCADIEEEIRSAHSREEAESAGRRACGKLQDACLSRLVERALVRRTGELIELYWGNAGKSESGGPSHSGSLA